MENDELLQAIGQMMDEKLRPVKEDVQYLKILLENDIPKKIQLLAEGHEGIVERLPAKHEINSIKGRLSTLERVVAVHSDEIDELKEAK